MLTKKRAVLAAGLLAAAALSLFSTGSPLAAWTPPFGQSPDEMAAMMAKAKKFTAPGENHKLLERFLGEWNTEVRMFMGKQATPAEKGTATFRWKIEGRWLESEWSGTMMQQPARGAIWLGYDNFKMSYVSTMITSGDTAMNHAEGDLTQDQKSLLLYGTLDEYLTGEHDKMVKYAWRFLAADKMVLEIHDLPIGESDTKVVEITYTKAK